jgi:hypothetical protein
MRPSTYADQERLEDLVDQIGLPAVLDRLELVCYVKCSFIMQTWQANGLARAWDRSGAVLGHAGAKVEALLPREVGR